MEVVVALCLPSGGFALSLLLEEQAWGNSVLMWTCGFGAGAHSWAEMRVKPTKSLFMALDVLLGGVAWRNHGYKYRASVAWHRVIAGMRVGYF